MQAAKPLKLLAYIAGGIVALLVLLVVVVALVVDPNDYKDRIEAAIEKETGRPLTLEGDLKLSYFPWLALELGPAQLGQPKGFDAGPFLTVKSAAVGVKLIPLLRGRLEVSRLGLEGMQVNLVKNADGRTNWENLTEEDEEPQPAEAGGGPELGTIGGLTIRDAALDYRDLQAGTRRRVLDLDLETGSIDPGEPVEVDLSVVTDEGPDTTTTTAKLSTVATLDNDAQRYQFEKLVLDVTQREPRQDKGQEARELPIGLRADKVDADLKQQTLALPQFLITVAGAQMSGTLTGQKILAAPVFSGQIAMKETSPRELMRQLDMEIPRTRDAEALTSLILNSKLQATDNSVAFDDLTLILDGQQVTGDAGIADLEKMALRFDLKADRLDLSRYEDPTEEKEEKEKAAAPFKLPVEALRELDAQGTFAIGTLKVSGMTLSDVSFKMDAGHGVTRINPSRAKMFGGQQHGNVVVNAQDPVARVNLDESLTAIDFGELFQTMFDSKRFQGKGNAKAVLSGRGNDSDAILRTLDGRLEFEVQEGAILGADLWFEIRRALALFKKQPMPAEASTGMTRFQKLRGSAVIQDGVVVNRDFIMDMDYLKVRGEGQLALATKKIDYKLTAEVYKLPGGEQEGQAVAMEDLKAMEIPVRVSGTPDALKIVPDLEGLAKARARQEIEERKGELQEKALDKLSDWLGNKKKKDD